MHNPAVPRRGARALVAPAQSRRARAAGAAGGPAARPRPPGAGEVGPGPGVCAMPPEPWGDRHRFTPQHALRRPRPRPVAVPPCRRRAPPLGGDTESVAATASIPGTDACVSGPIARVVWDLADRDASRWAVPLGAGGAVDQPHHDDQFTAWKDGTLIPVTAPSTPPSRCARVDPPSDAVMLHGWFTQPRATFWGMAERSLEEVSDIYGWIDDTGPPHRGARAAGRPASGPAADLRPVRRRDRGALRTPPRGPRHPPLPRRRPGARRRHAGPGGVPAGAAVRRPGRRSGSCSSPTWPTPGPSRCCSASAPSSARWRRSRRPCRTCPPRPPSSRFVRRAS